MASVEHFDITRFVKVLALVYGGSTEGERNAAKARAEQIAQKAGLTFDQAMSIVLSGGIPKSEAPDSPSQRASPPPKPTKADRDALLLKLRLVTIWGALELVFWSIFGIFMPIALIALPIYEPAAGRPLWPVLLAFVAVYFYYRFAKKRIAHIREAIALRAFLRGYPVSA